MSTSVDLDGSGCSVVSQSKHSVRWLQRGPAPCRPATSGLVTAASPGGPSVVFSLPMMLLPPLAKKTVLTTSGSTTTSGNTCMSGNLWQSVDKRVQSVELGVQSVEWQTSQLLGVMLRKLQMREATSSTQS